MRIHIIQHVSFEPAGNILDWARMKGHAITHNKMFEKKQDWPGSGDFDMLIIMGGPMGVYEEDLIPWLIPEKKFIRKTILDNKAILGICLGSQLLAEALGSRVYQSGINEIGFFPVSKTEAGKDDELFSSLPDQWDVFHWHGDSFDLPLGAEHIFRSAACEQQSFRKGNLVGMQFHPEIDAALLNSMIEHERDELQPAKFVQSEDAISSYKNFEKNKNEFFQFLDKMTDLC